MDMTDRQSADDQAMDKLASRFFEACKDAGESEQKVIDRVKRRLHISQNASDMFESKMTFGESLADRIASFGGSWTFILLFFALLAAWVVLNALVLTRVGKPFDPYPFIFLNLVLSMLAALQAPVIMMSQNRQAAKDRVVAAHDYEVNLKAELEILGLHTKVDTLREQQWIELVEMQQRQIQLLTKLVGATDS
jgi:uncharacterized membrane protein